MLPPSFASTLRHIHSGTWLVVFALALLAPPVAHAQVYDDTPASASRGPGDEYVFARAADGAILERHRTPIGWTAWSSLGGAATSGPAAIAHGRTISVFVRGPDAAVYQNTLENGAWSDWRSLGGVATSAASATMRRGLDVVDLAVRGGDNAIWHRWWAADSGWSAWASLGGSLTLAPALNSQSTGVLNVFSRGLDGSLVQRAWNGSAWGAWATLGGAIVGAPAVVSRAENIVDVYVRGAGDATFERWWVAGVGWSDWYNVDATAISSSLAAASSGPGGEWLWARQGASLIRKEWNGTLGWGPWHDFGPVELPAAPSAPKPTPTPAPDGELSIETGVRCTPPGGRLRVDVDVRKPKGKRKARVTRIVFFTKGAGRAVRVDRKAPFVVRIKINRPAGSTGRVYARVYYKRSARGKLHRKTVSRRYTVCR